MIFKDNTAWPTHNGLFAIGDYTYMSHCDEGYVFVKANTYRENDFADDDSSLIELHWVSYRDEDDSGGPYGILTLSLPLVGETIDLNLDEINEWGRITSARVAYLPIEIRSDLVRFVCDLAQTIDASSIECTTVLLCYKIFQSFWAKCPSKHLTDYVDFALSN